MFHACHSQFHAWFTMHVSCMFHACPAYNVHACFMFHAWNMWEIGTFFIHETCMNHDGMHATWMHYAWRKNHAGFMDRGFIHGGMVDVCMYHAWYTHDTCIHAWDTLKHACFMCRISSREGYYIIRRNKIRRNGRIRFNRCEACLTDCEFYN